eukprot:scaffold1102_cov116-Isochrysis_galbana.AAC.4
MHPCISLRRWDDAGAMIWRAAQAKQGAAARPRLLATRDLERPRPSSRSNCMVCRAGLASRAPPLAVRLAGLSSLAFILHSQRCVASLGAVNSVVCLAANDM